jgi:magnesium-protoporphyrin O-methyltransferase
MDCCECQGLERFFNKREAASSLKRYRRRGPLRGTRVLLDALRAEEIAGATLLDIGGGIGAIHLELLADGVRSATDVDGSAAYLAAARGEAERRGYGDRVSFHHGDFVALAPAIEPADIVTLDRVICCYSDMPALVGASAAKARRLYGLVYPRDSWWMRLGAVVERLLLRVGRNQFRFFVHRTSAVDAAARAAGLEPQIHRMAGVWQVAVYARAREKAG